MISMGIGVHKKTRTAAIKNHSAKILGQIEFSNTADAARKSAGQIKGEHALRKIQTVCEATWNVRVYPLPIW